MNTKHLLVFISVEDMPETVVCIFGQNIVKDDSEDRGD
jgi:hypothetical protein